MLPLLKCVILMIDCRQMTSSTADTAPTAPFCRIGDNAVACIALSLGRAATCFTCRRHQIRRQLHRRRPAASSVAFWLPTPNPSKDQQASFSFFVGTLHSARCKWVGSGEQKISCSTFPFALDDRTAASCPQHVRGILFFLSRSRPATRALVGFLSARAATANVQTGVCISLCVLSKLRPLHAARRVVDCEMRLMKRPR